MKVLVTGGRGFVGSNLALALEREGHDVTTVDHRESGGRDMRDFRGKTIVADVSDASFWKSLKKFDAVFHEAACTDTTVRDEAFMMRHNRDVTLALFKWALGVGADVIYASSAAVYGNAKSPQCVGEGESPLNVYGKSKLAVDTYVRENLAHAPVKIIGLRYFNVFGPGEAHKGHMASMIYTLAQEMHAGKRPRIFRDGTQSRDHIYIDDVIQANLLALKASKQASGIYNVGTGHAVSFNAVIDALNETLGLALAPEYIENPYAGFYQDHTEADISETTERLSFHPRFDIRSGIRAYCERGTG